ncbi:MAG: LLM class flavin-dependent oxidoreductase [Verrucomicrobiota bacterium]
MASTLDQLSNGRLDLGLGLGNPTPHQAVFGLDETGPGGRLKRFTGHLAAMKALFSDGKATVESGERTVNGVPMEPKPVQRPAPKIWFGGRHPNALRRAAELADGWMGAGSSTTEDFTSQAEAMREVLSSAGRAADSFRIAKRLYVAVDSDEARAARRLREWFEQYYGRPQLADRVCVWGSLEKVMDEVGRVTGAGAEMVLLNPLFDQTMHLRALSEAIDKGR